MKIAAGSRRSACFLPKPDSPGVTTDGHAVFLNYWVDGERVRERVALDRTQCNYGGDRPWFRCPGCRRRVALLYGGPRFRCRQCHGLAYRSTREDALTRAFGRANDLARRAGGMAGIPGRKPHGMHWRTYERLIERWEEAEERALGGLGFLLKGASLRQ